MTRIAYIFTAYNSYLNKCTKIYILGIAKRTTFHIRMLEPPHNTTNMYLYALHWRHNDHTSVSNHQPHDCLLNRLFRRRSKKTSKLRVTGLCVGNSPGPVNSPHKAQLRGKCFHLMTSSWIASGDSEVDQYNISHLALDCRVRGFIHHRRSKMSQYYFSYITSVAYRGSHSSLNWIL